MKKFLTLGLLACIALAFGSCKDEVYFPEKEKEDVDDKVTIDFNPSILHPFNPNHGGGHGSGNQGTSVPTDTGDAWIYIFPGDNLQFSVNGIPDTGAEKVEILVNGTVVDTFVGDDIKDPLSYNVDHSHFRPGKNELAIRFTFPNGSQVTKRYYYIVFPELPMLVFDIDFSASVSIADSETEVCPSRMEVTSDDADLLVDATHNMIYLVAGRISTSSTLATDSNGRFGDLWVYNMTLVPTLDREAGNVDVKDLEYTVIWDGTVNSDSYTCHATRTSVKDLDWEGPFDSGHHSVAIVYSYKGYITVEGESYYYEADSDCGPFTLSAKHPQSRN